MEIKELSNTKKNLEFCRIMFRSPVLGYEKVKCTEMHFKKKVCLNLFFFSLAWAPVIMSNNLEKEKKENGLRSSTTKIKYWYVLLSKLDKLSKSCKPLANKNVFVCS